MITSFISVTFTFRKLFVASRDGIMPDLFGGVHNHYRTPIPAVLCIVSCYVYIANSPSRTQPALFLVLKMGCACSCSTNGDFLVTTPTVFPGHLPIVQLGLNDRPIALVLCNSIFGQ